MKVKVHIMNKYFISAILLALVSCSGQQNGADQSDNDSIDSNAVNTEIAENPTKEDVNKEVKVIEGLETSELSSLGIKASIKDGMVVWSADKAKYLKSNGYLMGEEFYRNTQNEIETKLDGEKAVGVYLCKMDDMEAMIIAGSNHTLHLANISMMLGDIDFHVGKVAENFDVVKFEMGKNKAVAIDAEGNKREISFADGLPYESEFEADGKQVLLILSSVYTINLDIDGDDYRGSYKLQGNKVTYTFNQVVKGESSPETLKAPITGSFTYNDRSESYTFGDNTLGIPKGTPFVCEIFPIFN